MGFDLFRFGELCRGCCLLQKQPCYCHWQQCSAVAQLSRARELLGHIIWFLAVPSVSNRLVCLLEQCCKIGGGSGLESLDGIVARRGGGGSIHTRGRASLSLHYCTYVQAATKFSISWLLWWHCSRLRRKSSCM